MKPEHFLYKSDGLYYMHNVPVKDNFIDWENHKSLERAKEEAVLVTDPYVYQIAMHRYFPHFIDYSKTPQDNFKLYAEHGYIYTINMEENIEIVEEPEFPGFDHTSYPTFRRIARIKNP